MCAEAINGDDCDNEFATGKGLIRMVDDGTCEGGDELEFQEDENGDFQAPFLPGDSIYVELHSITNEAFFFLSEVQFQTDRPGGFAELFATPLSNVVTNIIPSDENAEVVGFFNVSAVSGNGKRLVE